MHLPCISQLSTAASTLFIPIQAGLQKDIQSSTFLKGITCSKAKSISCRVVNDEHKLDFFKDKLLKDPGVVVLMVARWA